LDTTLPTDELRNIQRELADMRDDRTVMIAILNRLDASVTSLSAEIRALRSQLDRWRNDANERVAALEAKDDK
jgi:septal ring factor EnvC (AmiA/AmiB activator)